MWSEVPSRRPEGCRRSGEKCKVAASAARCSPKLSPLHPPSGPERLLKWLPQTTQQGYIAHHSSHPSHNTTGLAQLGIAERSIDLLHERRDDPAAKTNLGRGEDCTCATLLSEETHTQLRTLEEKTNTDPTHNIGGEPLPKAQNIKGEDRHRHKPDHRWRATAESC